LIDEMKSGSDWRIPSPIANTAPAAIATARYVRDAFVMAAAGPQRTENGAWYGRPYAVPASTVLVGRMYTVPWRLLLRVSTNSTGP